MIHPKMLGAFPAPKPKDMVEIMNGPHMGRIGRLRCIKDGRGRVVFSSLDRSVLVSMSYLKVAR